MAHQSGGLASFIQSLGGGLERGFERRQQQKAQTQQQKQQISLLKLQDLFGQQREERREERGIAGEERRFERDVDLLGKRADSQFENSLKLLEARQKFKDPTEVLPNIKDAKDAIIGTLGEGESITVDTRQGRATFKGPRAEKISTITPGKALTQFRLNEPGKKDTATVTVNKWRTQFDILKSQGQEVTDAKIQQIKTWSDGIVPFLSKLLPGTKQATQKKINAKDAALQLIEDMRKYNSDLVTGKFSQQKEFRAKQVPASVSSKVRFQGPSELEQLDSEEAELLRKEAELLKK